MEGSLNPNDFLDAAKQPLFLRVYIKSQNDVHVHMGAWERLLFMERTMVN